ncbi:hypothetical protein P3X46_012041 [Hevea brasiliensis]|uniref:DUF7745 domain-containing protein n=1 Tax=Hevea brasiliensis TaxID=3981 RepID=A0ABQ9M8Z0_HEVBR|nr:uncharacterized protein LOC110647347 [Hevea brasiliensis]XP_058005948.1 uncharacterized protein LOC110647347 [Hevea brasiliensis]KAJ9176761.1 hypothetical protein P3X46_012041 [Hevea brasiliensis]
MDIPSQAVKEREANRCESHGWSWKYMEQIFQDHMEKGKFESAMKVLALGIYGLILLSGPRDRFSHTVLKLFHSMEVHKINPIPAILGKTLLTLSYCRTKGNGSLNGCCQLLYLWLLSHILPQETRTLTWFSDQSIIDNMVQLSLKQEDQDENKWIERILSFNSTIYCRKKLWRSNEPCMFKTNNFQFMPLMGVTGCSGYSTALVMRQFVSTQFIPQTKGFSEMHFYYKEEGKKDELKKIHQSWEKVILNGETRGPSITEGYPMQRKKRDIGYDVPSLMGPENKTPRENIVEDYFEEVKARQDVYFQKLDHENQ